MTDISEVQQHARFERRISARGHLPKTGYAGFHFEALLMPRPVEFNIFQWVRARPNQTHVPLQDVPQLRQLVQAVFAQKFAEPRDPRIICNLEERAPALIQMAKARGWPTVRIVREMSSGLPYREAMKLARKAAPLLDITVSEFMRLRKNE